MKEDEDEVEKERALMIALTFVMAPLPNSICSRCGNAGDYSETNSAYVDFGRFLTGMFVVSSFHTSTTSKRRM
jgi:hypothetical protein